MDKPNADYDSVWKQAIERYWTDFTGFFLLEERESVRPPESLDQELAQCSRGGRAGVFRVDKLLRAPGPDGRPCLWHVEIQVARQRGFAERMFVCQYRLYDRFHLPMRSIAILGDPSPTWRPERFELSTGKTHVSFGFETVKLRDFDDHLGELLLEDNVFAWLVAAHLLTLRTRREPGARMIVKNSLLTALCSCGWQQQKFLDVYDLIDRMMSLPDALQAELVGLQQIAMGRCDMAWVTLWEQRLLARGMQEGRQEGWQEGRQEGRVEALRQILISQLATRFGPPGEDVRRRVEAAGLEELERWCLAVVTARTIDEVF
jgi:hypothetical protein